MRHDLQLASASAPATNVQPLPVDPRRAIEIEVWSHYIDSALKSAPEMMPFDAARRLLKRLETTGAAQVRTGVETRQIAMLGISASTNGSEYTLLRNWQAAALTRLREARA